MAIIVSPSNASVEVVQDLLRDAFLTAGIIGFDQTLSAEEQSFGLRRLQRMLDSMSNERQMVYMNDSETFTMTAGQQAYDTSLLPNGRPVAIQSMRVTLNNIDFPVEQIDQLEWNSISYKGTTAIPRKFYYDDAYPNATMYFYPKPYADLTVTIYCQRQLMQNVGLTTVLAMPLGYAAMVVANLAVDIAPSFGKQPTQQMIKTATETKANLKRTNYMPLEMQSPFDGTTDISNGFPYRGF